MHTRIHTHKRANLSGKQAFSLWRDAHAHAHSRLPQKHKIKKQGARARELEKINGDSCYSWNTNTRETSMQEGKNKGQKSKGKE